MTSQRQGELYILASALLWGLLPVITILSFASLPALVSLGLSTLIAAVFFAVVLTVRGRWSALKNTAVYKAIAMVTIINGVIYPALLFSGLQYTSAGNTAIIALSEVFFSFLLFHVLRRDHIPCTHIIGAVLMILGALIVLAPAYGQSRSGDLLILLASAVAPLGNYFQQQARYLVSSDAILFVRSAVSGIAILLFTLLVGPPAPRAAIIEAMPLLLVNGIFLFGLSKIFWVESIHRISVTKANALSSVEPFVTLAAAMLILNDQPTLWQLVSVVPMCAGMILLSRRVDKSTI
ncbi:DMT family transporter [Candidatus Uhrbacteria bacterium]|nr:DMT family transporter [Candidatus Uhrbacteria bacterium]